MITPPNSKTQSQRTTREPFANPQPDPMKASDIMHTPYLQAAASEARDLATTRPDLARELLTYADLGEALTAALRSPSVLPVFPASSLDAFRSVIDALNAVGWTP